MICAQIHNVTKVMCALYALQKECRKVWGARYTLGARYRSENRYLIYWLLQNKMVDIHLM